VVDEEIVDNMQDAFRAQHSSKTRGLFEEKEMRGKKSIMA
jgi:hypothetical protein